MARLRYNNVYGTLGASQSNVATTLTLAAQLTYNDGTAVPTIAAPDTLDITLEPLTANFEVEQITAYTSGATAATVTRAIAGAAKTHANGVQFGHDPTISDFDGSTYPEAADLVMQRAFFR